MDQKRRQLLHAVGGLGVLGLLATAGLISPARLQLDFDLGEGG